MLGLQEMAVGIIGLCIGMLLAHAVAGSSGGGFVVFALLTLAHLACNYKAASPCPCTALPFLMLRRYQAVRSVRLTSISDERMGALVNSART